MGQCWAVRETGAEDVASRNAHSPEYEWGYPEGYD